jgi:cell division septal protein FtsQ
MWGAALLGSTSMPKSTTRVVDRPAIVARLSRFGRALATAAKVLVGLCLVLGTAAATGWGGYRLARTSSHFSLSHLSVDSSTRMSDWVVARAAGVKRGDNLIALDLRAAEKRLSERRFHAASILTSLLSASTQTQ